jgi:phenylalanyl-tRNA synthetase beta subunit
VPSGANKDAPLPIKLFEVSDVVLLSGAKGCGAANQRRLVAVLCDRAASFELIHGLLNRVMEVLQVPYTREWARRASPSLADPGMPGCLWAHHSRLPPPGRALAVPRVL